MTGPSNVRALPQHGTYARYQVEKRSKKGTCSACRAANAERLREYRADNPDSRDQEKAYEATRRRAVRRLSELHAEEFSLLFAEELRTAGLTEDEGAQP